MSDPNKNLEIDDASVDELEESAEEIAQIAKDLGLSPNDVNYWLVDHDEINELAAYDGFQTRYPHWRWGMKYLRRKKKDTYFGGKIFELVNHDEPANAFLQVSNSLQDQKSVIAHVEAHSDFFANNNFFQNNPNAAEMLERHANVIESYYEDPSIEYSKVEKWIDSILSLESTIDQNSTISSVDDEDSESDNPSVEDQIESLDISEDIKRDVFNNIDQEDEEAYFEEDTDVLRYLIEYGKQYDESTGRAVEYEDWQRTILEIIRREVYYFSAQKMTKIMNEGWAAFWESLIMTSEAYAETDEIIEYADRQSKVLNAPGLNPYKIGKEIWEYIESRANRREVAEEILRIDGITWRNFHSDVDFTKLINELRKKANEDVPCERHYSLLRNQNLGFIEEISQDELQQISRYMFDTERYSDVSEAVSQVNFEAGWKKMREVRETNNDITFIDSYLTEEFVNSQDYFSYEFNPNNERYEVSGTDLESVKKNLLLQITNGGKPTIIAGDRNYNNSGELLLKHQYNGIPLDFDQAEEVIKNVFRLWGRPVNLKTIDKDMEGNEQGIIMRYDGERVSEKETDDIEDIQAEEIDYDTKPDEWL